MAQPKKQKVQLPETTGLDPFGEFLTQAFLQGAVPGSQTSAFNTVLDLISPGALQERREATEIPAPQRFQELFGLSPEETDQLVRQQVGLQISPTEQFFGNIERQKALADLVEPMLKAETERGKTAAFKERTKAYEDIARIRQQDPAKGFELTLQQAFITGQVPDTEGNLQPVDEETRKRIGQTLGIVKQNPIAGQVLGTLMGMDFLDDELKSRIISDATGLPIEFTSGFFSDTATLGGGAETPEQVGELPEEMELDEESQAIAVQQFLQELIQQMQ